MHITELCPLNIATLIEVVYMYILYDVTSL